MSIKTIAAATFLILPALSLSASFAEAGWRDNTISKKDYVGSASKAQRLPIKQMQKVCVEWGPKQNPNDFAGPCVRWEYREAHEATTH
jgi:hypothetical protein